MVYDPIREEIVFTTKSGKEMPTDNVFGLAAGFALTSGLVVATAFFSIIPLVVGIFVAHVVIRLRIIPA